MNNKYFRKRNNTFYYKKSKQEIYNFIDINNYSSFLPILKDMNYPFFIKLWEKIGKEYGFNKKLFGRYISKIRLYAYKNFIWNDSIILNEINQFDDLYSPKEKYKEFYESWQIYGYSK